MNTRWLLKKFVFISLFALATTVQADSLLTTMTDSVNTGIIKSKIALDSSLADLDVDVNVDHGFVTFTGVVNNEAEEQRMIQIAKSVSGVNGVDIAKLRVRDSEQPLSDSTITAKIKALFIRENLFGKSSVPVISINVNTNNGIVSLTGKAENQDQINNAIKLAKSINGVKNVESHVVISK